MGAEVWGLYAFPLATSDGKPRNEMFMPAAQGAGVYAGPTISATKGRLFATANASFVVVPPH